MPLVDMLPDFVGTLVPASHDRSLVATRKEELIETLKGAGIGVVTSFESGSFSHGTGVKDHFDVDQMMWVTLTERPQLPSSALTRFRTALSNMSVKSVTVSSPTVRIEYWSAPHFEVVPAYYSTEVGDTIVYEIPGRRDEWVLSAPRAHNDLVNAENERLGRRLKALIRLAKAWKYNVGAPVSSFYLEMRATEYAKDETVIIHSIDLRRVLQAILSKGVADMNDPAGIAGRIPACASEDHRRAVVGALTTAHQNLVDAEAYRQADDAMNYWASMYRVFGQGFPWPRKS